jgi:hypothetical protein
MDEYAQGGGMTATALANTETLGSLLQDAEPAPDIAGFVTVAPTATLGQVRTELDESLRAKDVFVRDTGQRRGTVVGWLINSDEQRQPSCRPSSLLRATARWAVRG